MYMYTFFEVSTHFHTNRAKNKEDGAICGFASSIVVFLVIILQVDFFFFSSAKLINSFSFTVEKQRKDSQKDLAKPKLEIQSHYR